MTYLLNLSKIYIPVTTKRELICGFLLIIGFAISFAASSLLVMVFSIAICIFVCTLLKRKYVSETKRCIDLGYRQVEALVTLHNVINPILPIPPMRGSALSPDMANILITLLKERKPQVVLECGSGVSTILTCYCLKDNNRGHLWSLDHEQKYLKITQRNLKRHELDQYATIIHAPLKKYSLDSTPYMFYDVEDISKIPPIDFLFIDGPPRTVDPMGRFPALPLLFSRLSEDAIVVLDDAAREAEKTIVEIWKKIYPQVKYSWFDTEKGTVVLTIGHDD